MANPNDLDDPERGPEPPDSPETNEPDVVGTPEGDNEFAPDEPLGDLPADAEQVERGGDPGRYRQPENTV